MERLWQHRAGYAATASPGLNSRLGAAVPAGRGQRRYGYGATAPAPSQYREGEGAAHCTIAPRQSHWSANDSDLLPNKGMS